MVYSPSALVHAALALIAFAVAVRLAYAEWQRHKLGPYEELLSPQAQLWIEGLTVLVSAHTAAADERVRHAFDLWGDDLAVARRRLDDACDRLERVAVPELQPMLATLRRLLATVEVLPPPRPTAAAACQLLHARGPLSLVRFATWLVVTGRKRLGVRLWFVRRALAVAAHACAGTALLVPRHGFGQDWYESPQAACHLLGRPTGAVTAADVLAAFARWQAHRCRAV